MQCKFLNCQVFVRKFCGVLFISLLSNWMLPKLVENNKVGGSVGWQMGRSVIFRKGIFNINLVREDFSIDFPDSE